MKLMFNTERLRQEDHWIYPIVFVNVLATGAAMWASVLMFRAPALLIAAIGIWFISNKLRRDYSPKKAKIHICATLIVAALLAGAFYTLTN